MRAVSLKHLEAALAKAHAEGKPLPPEVVYLAGLQRVRYVFVYPEQNDIVLAGPAEGWKMDALGNVVGSNIFNVFFILGVSAIIAPLPISASGFSDVWVAVAAAFLLFVAMFVGTRHRMDRWQGWAFIGCYAAYVTWLIAAS